MKRFAATLLVAFASTFATAQTAPSYQGLWWNFPANSESGWGLNITHQGNILFATLFTYDSSGNPMWLVIPDAELQSTDMGMDGYGYGMGMTPGMYDYMGAIYSTTGPALDAASFDPSSVKVTAVGLATLHFMDPDDVIFTYTVNGVTQSKSMIRQQFSTMPTCDFGGGVGNFQDLWWAAPAGSESGWGLNVAHQGNIIFATWFTYDKAGKGTWLVASNVKLTSGTTYSGDLFRTQGPAFMTAWDSSKVKVSAVGSITLSFSDWLNGTMTANVDGKTITKAITRQVFSTPQSQCR